MDSLLCGNEGEGVVMLGMRSLSALIPGGGGKQVREEAPGGGTGGIHQFPCFRRDDQKFITKEVFRGHGE